MSAMSAHGNNSNSSVSSMDELDATVVRRTSPRRAPQPHKKADDEDDEASDCLGRRSQIPKKKTKGSNFNDIELNDLLQVIEARLPLSNPEWEGVARDHAQKHPHKKRVANNLRLKFGKLWQTKVPTGDPNIPVHIREAKRIWRIIQAKIPKK
jgi:hypothetical protein